MLAVSPLASGHSPHPEPPAPAICLSTRARPQKTYTTGGAVVDSYSTGRTGDNYGSAPTVDTC
jgi:hypothetical protein